MPDPDRQTVSASQIAALFDRSPYLTRWMLWQWFANDIAVDVQESNRMTWGKRMEPLILDQARSDLHLDVEPDQAYLSNGPIGCTRDAQIFDPNQGPGALETKCAFDYRVWMQEWDGGNHVPQHIEIQLQAQMAVGNGSAPYDWGVVACWCGGDVFYFRRKADADLRSLMIEEAEAFLESVTIGDEPDPFGDPKEIPLLDRLYPAIQPDSTQELDDTDAGETARFLDYAAEQERFWKKNKETARAKLLAITKDISVTRLPGAVVRVSRNDVPESVTKRKAHTRTTLKVETLEDDRSAPVSTDYLAAG